MQLTPIGHPRFYVDLALEVWPQAHWPELLKKIQELGVYGVRIGAGLWGRLEPDLTEFRFDYIIKFLDLAESVGLNVILQNPTNFPPCWVYERFEDLLPVDSSGKPASLWSKNRVCYAHLGYRQLATHFMSAMVQSLSDHQAIGGWHLRASHTDLEGMLSYSHEAQEGFKRWLARRYRSIERLNFAWGLVQNSVEYARFSNIEIPDLSHARLHPAPLMDFLHFSARQREEFVHDHIAAIRAVSHLWPISVGYDGLSDLTADTCADQPHSWLDMALTPLSGDDDPHQRLIDIAFMSAKARNGRPGFGSVSLNVGPEGERQLDASAHRLRYWQALASGTKQIFLSPVAQPQIGDMQGEMGLFHLDGTKTPAGEALTQVISEIDQLDPAITDHVQRRNLRQADVAIISDMFSAWAHKIQPVVEGFDYQQLIRRFFAAVQGLGLEADIISQRAPDLTGYKAVIVPGLVSWTPELLTQLQNFDGSVVVGPRTGTRTPEFHIVGTLGPNLLPDWLDLKVLRIDGLGSQHTVAVKGGGAFTVWREEIATDRKIAWRTQEGSPAYVEQGRFSYLCGVPDDKLARRVMLHVMNKKKVDMIALPEGLYSRRLDSETSIYLNATPKRVDLRRRGLNGHFHLDGARLAPNTVSLSVDTSGSVSQAVQDGAEVKESKNTVEQGAPQASKTSVDSDDALEKAVQAMKQTAETEGEDAKPSSDIQASDKIEASDEASDNASDEASDDKNEATSGVTPKPVHRPRLSSKVVGKVAAVRRRAAEKKSGKRKKPPRRKAANGWSSHESEVNQATKKKDADIASKGEVENISADPSVPTQNSSKAEKTTTTADK